MNDYAFGNLITALRMERGFSQFQLGKLLGVSDKAVSKWENGNAKPRLATCQRLADILGVSVDELLSPPEEIPSVEEVFPEPIERVFEDRTEENMVSQRMDCSPEKRVELHMRTNMSRSDGIVRAVDLLARTENWGMPAAAITDLSNTRAFTDTVAFGRRDKQKVIYGCEMVMIPSAASPAEDGVHIMLLARNRTGLVHLNRLISLSATKYFKEVPCIPKECVEEMREGLLIGASAEDGEVFQMLQADASGEELEACVQFYDYLEVQPIENVLFRKEDRKEGNREKLEEQIRRVIRLGKQCGKPVAAVSCGRYLDPEDALGRAALQYHDGIAQAEIQPPYYLRTTEEMLDAFSFLGKEAAEEIVIHTTRALAGQVDDSIDLYPDTGNPKWAVLPLLPGAEEEIRALAMERAHAVYGDVLPGLIADRLEKEMHMISLQNGWSILAIARRAVLWSEEKGFPTGIRGTVGGSLVAWLIGICSVNPLPPHTVCPHCRLTEFIWPKRGGCGADLPERVCPRCGKPVKRDGFDIPVESFLGLDGKRQMDIDLNLSDEIQQSLHAYIGSWFGPERVFRPGTRGELSSERAERIVQSYLMDHPGQRKQPGAKDAAERISSALRTVGQHPGGLVILPEGYDINEFTPIQNPPDAANALFPITQYDFAALYNELFKMDFLGHTTPTLLGLMRKSTDVALEEIPIHDDGVMSLLFSPEALGVSEEDILASNGMIGIPEYGSEFIMGIVKAIRPTTVEELIRIQGWAHGTDIWLGDGGELIWRGTATPFDLPGTRDDITNYLRDHGVPFDIAFSISELVRKGMGFKVEDRPEIIELLREARVPGWYLDACKKMRYLFPRSHAAAYTMDALRVAWFKLYHPEAFYPAWFRVKGEHLEAADLTMDVKKLRKAILSIRTELRYMDWKRSDEESEKKERVNTLTLLLEMKLRGCSLPDDFLSKEQEKR